MNGHVDPVMDKQLSKFLRMRNLILAFVVNEVERLSTWYNPQLLPEYTIHEETTLTLWKIATFPDTARENKFLRDEYYCFYFLLASFKYTFRSLYMQWRCSAD